MRKLQRSRLWSTVRDWRRWRSQRGGPTPATWTCWLTDRAGRHLGYEELASRSAELRFHDVVVRVADLDDVIASKEWADRPKDREALPELRRLRDADQQN